MTDCAQPLLSIIIPTRERADTLKYAIATTLDQKTDAFEVIVSDNCSLDDTKEVFQSFSDHRLRYINTGRRLSMCDNWDFALDHARGRYIIFIGDDDAVLPGALDKLQGAIRDNPSPIFTWPKGGYNWPIAGRKAVVDVFPRTIAPFELDLKRLARRSVRQGFWGYSRLPSVYHSAVAKDILDKLRNSTGRVFHTTQPDLFTGFALPAYTDTAINLGYSVTLPGRCAKSNGASTFYKAFSENNTLHRQEFGVYQIHPTLCPGNWIRANTLVDSLLVAMDLFPELYGKMKFNYEGMWTMFCLGMNKTLEVSAWETIRHAREIRRYHPFSVLRFLGYLTIYKAFLVARKSLKRSTPLGPFKQTVPDNIHDFVKQLAEWQVSQKVSR